MILIQDPRSSIAGGPETSLEYLCLVVYTSNPLAILHESTATIRVVYALEVTSFERGPIFSDECLLSSYISL